MCVWVPLCKKKREWLDVREGERLCKEFPPLSVNGCNSMIKQKTREKKREEWGLRLLWPPPLQRVTPDVCEPNNTILKAHKTPHMHCAKCPSDQLTASDRQFTEVQTSVGVTSTFAYHYSPADNYSHSSPESNQLKPGALRSYYRVCDWKYTSSVVLATTFSPASSAVAEIEMSTFRSDWSCRHLWPPSA